MTVPIISDSHGYGRRLENIFYNLNRINERVEELIFLGDGGRDVMGYIPDGVTAYAVLGNCDSRFSFPDADGVPEERTEIIGGKRILMMHGHRYGVKHSYLLAVQRASELCADVLLFGHTHLPYYEMIPKGETESGVVLSKPLHVFNPGALCEGSFGLLTVKNGEILLSHGRV